MKSSPVGLLNENTPRQQVTDQRPTPRSVRCSPPADVTDFSNTVKRSIRDCSSSTTPLLHLWHSPTCCLRLVVDLPFKPLTSSMLLDLHIQLVEISSTREGLSQALGFSPESCRLLRNLGAPFQPMEASLPGASLQPRDLELITWWDFSPTLWWHSKYPEDFSTLWRDFLPTALTRQAPVTSSSS